MVLAMATEEAEEKTSIKHKVLQHLLAKHYNLNASTYLGLFCFLRKKILEKVNKNLKPKWTHTNDIKRLGSSFVTNCVKIQSCLLLGVQFSYSCLII